MLKTASVLDLVGVTKRFVAPDGVSPLTAIERVSLEVRAGELMALVGANAAGFTLHLLPAFGTLLALVFLGESFHLFHAAGIATILAGVAVATTGAARPRGG